MKLRCDLHVNDANRKLILVSAPNESPAHMGLRLAAYLLFWDEEPVMEAGAKNPALADFEFLPDLMALDDSGTIKLWVECGTTTMHKLLKLTRRLSRARIVVMKQSERDALRLRQDLRAQLDREARVEILAWPAEAFRDWTESLLEKTEVFGEAGGLMLNLVINERPIVAELKPL
ncbi:MAG: YaeQ family protein [Elusimicrobia bacterium]|nr:YaeQ family protein [Elusimicrobiota bacterium]